MKKSMCSAKIRVKQIVISLSITALFSLSGYAQQSEIQFPVKVGVKPESITKGFNGNYYVTLMNGAEKGDGEVVEISKNGVKIFAKGFDEPKGIVFLEGHLYLSDVTRIWKVDSKGHATVFIKKEDFPEAVLYLNDVAVDADRKGIYVADMGATKYMRDENKVLWPLDSEQAKLVPQLGRIYHVDLAGRVTITQDTSPLLLNPNGVGVDNNGNIMVGAFFLGNFLVKREGKLTPLKGQFRGADGVEQDSKGDYYVSSWTAGTVWKIDGKTEKATILIEGLKSAADFYLEEEKGRLLLPDMLAGMIYAVDIKNEKTVFEENKGIIAVEAEHFYKQSKNEVRQWYRTSSTETPKVGRDEDENHNVGASNNAYLEILPDTRVTAEDELIVGENFSNEAGQMGILHYKVKFNTPGRYYVWARIFSTGAEDNGLHVGIDGTWPEHGQRMQWCEGKNEWTWGSAQRTELIHCGVAKQIYLDIEKAGIHDIQFSMREDGVELDKFLLTKDIDYVPMGEGPAEIILKGTVTTQKNK